MGLKQTLWPFHKDSIETCRLPKEGAKGKLELTP